MSDATEKRLLTPMEAAERLDLMHTKDPERIILGMARRGELEAVRVSKWTKIRARSVERIVEGKR